ncbi:rhodanese-like domain-containing protein [Streptomyces sp. MUM 136J]|uniref:rhodanese-like domain-containing protein n=1 Tax=Streptomyces sp. MUM 136J TaxID=2791992 RepID=UPI001F0503A0|nr:rhodanese-like domain-containing protein [Streptomyces sp. MUM 136J]MCH0570390.1 rhodanese-like domain-containing protein [Streptomyces sp. MUM 136J]
MREADLDAFVADLARGAFTIDVREWDGYRAGHVPGTRSVPLPALGGALGDLPGDRTVYVICAGGTRSARAAGHLTALGMDAVSVAGGTGGRAATGRPPVPGEAVHTA